MVKPISMMLSFILLALIATILLFKAETERLNVIIKEQKVIIDSLHGQSK